MADYETCDRNMTYGELSVDCQDEFAVFDPYLNSCVYASVIQFTDQEMEAPMQFIYGYLLPALATVVILTNGVVIWVLNEQKTKRVTIDPLLYMAISALLMCISPLPFTIYYYTLGHFRDSNESIVVCYLHKICMESLPLFFNMLITFYTLLLGTQRLVAVQFPLNSFRWCTRNRIRLYSKIIFIFSILLTAIHSTSDIRVIYHFCIGNYDETVDYWVGRCFVGHSAVARAMGSEVFSTLIDVFRLGLIVIPSILLIIITFLLISTIRTSEAPQQKLTVHRHKMRRASANTTTMLTVIIVLFLLARLPSATLILLVKLEHYLPIAHLGIIKDSHLIALANLAMLSLHPLTFAVYIFMSRRFRISLRRLLGLRFLASDEDFNALTYSSTRQLSHQSLKSAVSRKPFPMENLMKNSQVFTSIRISSRSSISAGSGHEGREGRSSIRRVVAFSPRLDETEARAQWLTRRCESTSMQIAGGSWKDGQKQERIDERTEYVKNIVISN